MPDYLLIESQSTWAGPGRDRFVCDAVALAEAGDAVWLFLVQDGVTAALLDAVPALREVLRLGGRVWVDGFSLGQRGLTAGDLTPDVEVVDMNAVAKKLLEQPVRAVWH